MTNTDPPSDPSHNPSHSPAPDAPPGEDLASMPPPMAPPPPSARMPQQAAVRPPGPFRRGFGLGAGVGAGLGAMLLVVGTVISLLSAVSVAAVGVLAPSANAAGTSQVSTVWGSAGAKHKLRAIDVSGTILTDASSGAMLTPGTYGYEVASTLDKLTAKDADAVVLRLNTPGGTVTGSKAIADAVDRYRQRTGKKVFAHVQGMSASGGMYAMAGADEIQADYGSMIGSIGVIFGPFARYRDVTALDNGLLPGGVTAGKIEQFYLSQGKGKDAGNPYRDLAPDEREVFTRGLANEYAAFVDHVATKRKLPAQAIRDDLGAHLFDNVGAKEKGLIDGSMGIDEAYRHFAGAAGLDPGQTRVVAAKPPSVLEAMLGAERRVAGQALPVSAQAGVRPVTAPAVCGPAPTVLAYHGDPSRVCG